MDASDDAHFLLGLTLPDALRQRRDQQAMPLIQRTAPPRPRVPLPATDEGWRVVRVDAGEPPVWVVAPSIEFRSFPSVNELPTTP